MATRKPDWADRQMQKALKTWNPSEAWQRGKAESERRKQAKSC